MKEPQKRAHSITEVKLPWSKSQGKKDHTFLPKLVVGIKVGGGWFHRKLKSFGELSEQRKFVSPLLVSPRETASLAERFFPARQESDSNGRGSLRVGPCVLQ